MAALRRRTVFARAIAAARIHPLGLIGHSMAISIVVSDTVRFKVSGTINSSEGVPQPFDFRLSAQRMKDTEAVQEYLRDMVASDSPTQVTDALLRYVRGWSGVKDGDGQDVPYSEEAFRSLMRIPGLAMLTHTAFLRECGAKEKN